MNFLHRIFPLVLAAPLLVACGGKAPPPPPAPPVVVAHPLASQVEDWDDFEGQFESPASVTLRPRVSGYVTAVDFKDGQTVAKGQVLFQIDPRPYQAADDQAKAQAAHAAAALADAKIELARSKALLAAHATSQEDVDTRLATERGAAADLATAQAAERTAALNLAFTRVVAPISGRASDAKALPGNLVTQDSTILTTIVSVDPIRFRFTGDEAEFLKYRREGLVGGAAQPPVRIRLQDEATWRWKGRLAFVDNAFDPASGVISAYALVDNPTGFLTPGMFGHLKLLGSRPYQAILAPDRAVVADQSREVVYVAGADGRIAERVVALGPVVDGLRVIRSGLSPSDWVVIEGMQHAQPGKKATIRYGRIGAEADTPAQPEAPPAASATFVASAAAPPAPAPSAPQQ